jgi:predicted permease
VIASRLSSLFQDVRYALRQLRKAPPFALTAVAVLALGLGANIAVFTLIEGILLRPLPYAQPSRIVAIEGPQKDGYRISLNYANMRQLSDSLGTTVPMGAVMDESNASIAGPGGRYQVQKAELTASMFDLLGVQPVLGRGFRADENDPGRGQVLVLSDEAWRRIFRGDAQAIGKTLAIKGHTFTVVGVMPKGFAFPFGSGEMQVWAPASITPVQKTAMSNGDAAWVSIFARRPDGMSLAQLQANINRTQAVIAKEVEDGPPATLDVVDYQKELTETARKPLGLLYAVVAGLWALACMNVTSLMLARAVSRTREQSVRAALGASRGRLLQQAVIESLMLSAIGSVVGLVAGQLAIKLLWHQIQRSLPLTSTVHVEWRVVVGLLVLTVITALLVGLFPALRATRRDVQSGLHGVNTTSSQSQNRTREALVVAQLALTLVFLVGAGLFLRTIHALRQVPLGFAQQNVLTGGVILNQSMHDPEEDKSSAGKTNIVQSSYLPLLERLRAIPGVKTAALSSVLPMRNEFMVTFGFNLDHKKPAKDQTPMAQGRLASAGLVDAMGIPMVSGRFFTEDDSATAPVVVVVNQAFVNKYLPGQDAIGHTVSMGKGRFNDARIVGVIGDVKQSSVTKPTEPEMYYCLAQMGPDAPLYNIATALMEVAIRGSVQADALRAQFDKALHEVAPDATTTDVKTIHEAVEDSFGSQTLTSYLLGGFAGLALLIASVGLYGLLSFAVAQRTREIGLRLALGAQKGNILNLVLQRALVLVLVGLTLGGTMAWFAVSLARSYIYGVQTHDAITFASVTVVLAVASFFAAWLPARNAASIEPMQALRSE